MNKSLRPLCKSDDFQHLACDCISHILLLHHKFVFFVVFYFAPILTSVYISWLIFLLFTDFLVPKMGKKKSLSEVQRAQIVALHGENLSERQISAPMECSKTAVHHAIAKYQQEGSYTDKKRTGRPRVTTAREDNVMRRVVVKSPTSSMKKIRPELLHKGRRISHMTVSRRLSKEFNLKSYKPAKKPKLTAAMKAERLEFTNNHQHWTAEQWGKVLFSDESTFQQFVVQKRHVCRPTGKRFDERYTISTVKHPPSQIVLWAMSRNGVAALSFLPPITTINGPKYVQMLSEKLKLHLQVHNCQIFMQDGAPWHRSKVAKIFWIATTSTFTSRKQSEFKSHREFVDQHEK